MTTTKRPPDAPPGSRGDLHCGEALLQLIEDRAGMALPSRMWSDAYLAAFAVTGDLRMVTFDRDFNRFTGLNCLRLPRIAH